MAKCARNRRFQKIDVLPATLAQASVSACLFLFFQASRCPLFFKSFNSRQCCGCIVAFGKLLDKRPKGLNARLRRWFSPDERFQLCARETLCATTCEASKVIAEVASVSAFFNEIPVCEFFGSTNFVRR